MGKKAVVSLITFLILGLAIIGERAHHPPKNVLSWDVFGYYLYLPSLFIYHDLEIENLEFYDNLAEKYNTTGTLYQITSNDEGDKVMRYPIGWTLLYFPFFFLGHIIALLSGFPVDGLSPPYQYAIGYGSLIFSLGGLYCFRRFLLNLFSDRITALLLVLVVLGTNYLHMVSKESVLPHNHIFALFAALCWLTYKWHRSPKLLFAFLIGLCGGLMAVSRPTTILAFLVPLLWGISNWQEAQQKLKSIWAHYKNHLLALVLGVLVPGLFQMVYWKIYAGTFVFYSYQDPAVGLDLLAPHTLNFLFSFRKGWFIFTPLVMVFIAGFFFPRKPAHKGLLVPILVYFLIHLYLTSSWTCWWYAGADYSQRAMLETYVLLALPMGWLLEYLSSKKLWVKLGAGILILALVCINLFHMWQFHSGILHDSRMTKDYYFKVMGKTYVKEGWKDLLLVKRSVTGKEKMPDSLRNAGQTIAALGFENGEKVDDRSRLITGREGNQQLLMDSGMKFSPQISIPFHKITDAHYSWLSIHAKITPLEPIGDSVYLVAHFEYDGKPYKYRAIAVENAEVGIQTQLSSDYMTPEVRSTSDNLKVYIWNRNGKKVLVDDIKVMKHNN